MRPSMRPGVTSPPMGSLVVTGSDLESGPASHGSAVTVSSVSRSQGGSPLPAQSSQVQTPPSSVPAASSPLATARSVSPGFVNPSESETHGVESRMRSPGEDDGPHDGHDAAAPDPGEEVSDRASSALEAASNMDGAGGAPWPGSVPVLLPGGSASMTASHARSQSEPCVREDESSSFGYQLAQSFTWKRRVASTTPKVCVNVCVYGQGRGRKLCM